MGRRQRVPDAACQVVRSPGEKTEKKHGREREMADTREQVHGFGSVCPVGRRLAEIHSLRERAFLAQCAAQTRALPCLAVWVPSRGTSIALEKSPDFLTRRALDLCNLFDNRICHPNCTHQSVVGATLGPVDLSTRHVARPPPPLHRRVRGAPLPFSGHRHRFHFAQLPRFARVKRSAR